MFDYKLALMTGVPIPIPELQITLHQPSIKEISMIGEKTFFTGIQLLCIDKKMVLEESVSSQVTNFEIFMMSLQEKKMADKKECVMQTLELILPSFQIVFLPRSILLNSPEVNVNIDESNFDFIQKLLREQFCLQGTDQSQFNPKGKKATEIANKLMKARQRVAEIKSKEHGKEDSAFVQYLSALSVGLGYELQKLIELTIYQFYDLVARYGLYLNWDIDIRSRLAGAKADKPLEDWMKSIH